MSHVPRAYCSCGHEMKVEDIGVILEAFLVDQNMRHYYKISSDKLMCVRCGTVVYHTYNTQPMHNSPLEAEKKVFLKG